MKRYLAFLLCILAFGSFGIFRHYADGAPSVLLAFARIAISIVVFLIAYRGNIPCPDNWKTWASFAISGFVIATAFTLYMEAYKYANVADVALLGFVDPLFVTVLAAWFLHEKVSGLDFLALGLSAVGIFFLLARAGGSSQEIGLVIATLAFAAGAANTVLARWEQRQKSPLSEVLFYPFVFASLYLALPAMRSAEGTALPPEAWFAIAGLGVCTAAAYWLYDYIMLTLGAHLTELSVRTGITVVATAFATALLGESIGERWGIAAVFLFASAAVLYYRSMKEKREVGRHIGHAH